MRIAFRLGVLLAAEAALADYRKAIPEKGEEDPFLSTTDLAHKRIALLESQTGKDKQAQQPPRKK